MWFYRLVLIVFTSEIENNFIRKQLYLNILHLKITFYKNKKNIWHVNYEVKFLPDFFVEQKIFQL